MEIRDRLLGNCPDCGVAPGENHTDAECDWAQCPGCGQQLLMCDGACDGYDGRPAIWHGMDQQFAIARQLGWWTTTAGIDQLVEDTTRVTVAAAPGMITWNRDIQTYIIGQIDEGRLDATLAESGL
jgi:hypothetical protein